MKKVYWVRAEDIRSAFTDRGLSITPGECNLFSTLLTEGEVIFVGGLRLKPEGQTKFRVYDMRR